MKSLNIAVLSLAIGGLLGFSTINTCLVMIWRQ